jgi:sporulation-control protein spo0M
VEKVDVFMDSIKELEAAMDRMNRDEMSEEEEKWYGKVTREIENVKISLNNVEIQKAIKHLGSAEMYMKMLHINVSNRKNEPLFKI